MLLGRPIRLLAAAFLFLGAVALGGCQSLNKGSFGAFKRSLNTKAHGYQIVAHPTGTAPTKFVERFEVRPGDCSASHGWSDCANDRERSELSGDRENDRGRDYWYGWSLYVPVDTPNVCPTKTALGQFHQTGAPPAFMFQNSCGGLWIDRNFGATTHMRNIIKPADLRGRWHRIAVHARWSADKDGFFKVYVNEDLKWAFKEPTNTRGRIYFKYGVYRTWLSYYKTAKGVDQVPAQIVYYANVRRAQTRAGLRPPTPK